MNINEYYRFITKSIIFKITKIQYFFYTFIVTIKLSILTGLYKTLINIKI